MNENTPRDTVILSSGYSGLTAAIYNGRANLKPIVLEAMSPVGITCLSLISLSHNSGYSLSLDLR